MGLGYDIQQLYTHTSNYVRFGSRNLSLKFNSQSSSRNLMANNSISMTMRVISSNFGPNEAITVERSLALGSIRNH